MPADDARPRPRDTQAASGAALPPRAVAAMLLLCAAWGLNMVAMKVGTEGIPPVLQAGLRSAVAAPLILAWCRWRGVEFVGWRRRALLLPGLAVGTVFAVEFVFLYAGLGLTTASRGVVFLYTAPFFVALGAHVLLPDDRLTPAKAGGLGVAFLGLLLALRRACSRRPAVHRCSATRCACWPEPCGPPRP